MQSDAAYERLRELIVSGTYPPGKRLTEIELAEELGMSRTPVREALRRLVAAGLVATAPRGAVVAAPDRTQVGHLLAVRAAMDALVAETAARRQAEGEIAPAALQAVERTEAKLEECVARGEPSAARRLDNRFHREIAQLADNPVALEILDRVADQLAIARNAEPPGRAARRAERADPERGEEHRRVLAAIIEGQPAAAWLAAREHANGADPR